MKYEMVTLNSNYHFCEESCIKMYKIFYRRRIYRIITAAVLLAVWIIGSSLLIESDSNLLRSEFNAKKSIEDNLLKKNIDAYCEWKERTQITENKTGTTEILHNALKGMINRDDLLFFPELDQMWCLVPKAASSSWSQIIVKVLNSNRTTALVDHDDKKKLSFQVILKNNYGLTGKEIFDAALLSKNVSKILLVRHPFQRIVSVYENKLKNRKGKIDGMYFFQNFGVKIAKKFRKNKKLKKKEPTFEEFVEYLINTDPANYDEHWRPISLLCSLCKVKYDFIVKVEDLGNYAHYYMTQLGFTEKKITEFPHENKYNQTLTGLDYIKYFRSIPDHQIKQLYMRFQDDFYLFQYSFLDFYIALRPRKK